MSDNFSEKSRLIKVFGLSGIFKTYSFFQDHPKLPFDEDTKRDCYHTRQLEVMRALLMKDSNKKIDICMGHDWPRGMHLYGNYSQLIKTKPFFEADIKSGKFGNPGSTLVLKTL